MNGALGAGLTLLLAVAAAADSLLPALLPGIVPLLLLAIIIGAAMGTGRLVIAPAAVGFDELEKTVAGTTVGLGLLALSAMGLAAVGALRPWAASTLVGAALVLGWGEAKAALPSISAGVRRASARPWLFAAVAVPLALTLWACLVPPHQYDSLVYHLALPQEYLRSGRLVPPGGIVYAHFPQNGEMLYSLALAFGCDVLAQMLTWSATALTIAWLVTFGRRITPAAPWAALLVATHSAILLMSSTTYVEPIVMLWITAAALAFEASDDGDKTPVLVLAGVFAGLALGTKYYAGLAAAALALRLLARGRWRQAFLFSAATSAVFAPWLIKNWIFIGNPVFPFLYRIFPATSIGWTADLAGGYFSVLTEYGHSHGLLRDVVELPVLLFRNPLRFGGGMDVLGDVGWDLLLWSWGYGLWFALRGRATRGFAAFTAVYAAGWFSTGVVLRFLTALAPSMALIAAAGALRWRAAASSHARTLAAGAALTLIAAHLFLVLFVHGAFESGATLLALESRDHFLSRRLDYYPCARAANGLPDNARVLVVGEQRGYYLNRPHRTSTVHAPNLFVQRANETGSSAELARALRADGFTHVLFVPREERRLGAGLGAFTAGGAERWREFTAGLSTDYDGPACRLAAMGAR